MTLPRKTDSRDLWDRGIRGTCRGSSIPHACYVSDCRFCLYLCGTAVECAAREPVLQFWRCHSNHSWLDTYGRSPGFPHGMDGVHGHCLYIGPYLYGCWYLQRDSDRYCHYSFIALAPQYQWLLAWSAESSLSV